ncbi:hypothetical protein HDV01_004584 [Terramyces sp. JEL0728]|nr:hypothetical protein HDV01_004584 [Terramyces sp. JEL0728]
MDIGIYVFVGLFGILILPTIAIVSYYYVKDCIYPKEEEPEEEYIILEIRPGVGGEHYNRINYSDSTLASIDNQSAANISVAVQTEKINVCDKQPDHSLELVIDTEDEHQIVVKPCDTEAQSDSESDIAVPIDSESTVKEQENTLNDESNEKELLIENQEVSNDGESSDHQFEVNSKSTQIPERNEMYSQTEFSNDFSSEKDVAGVESPIKAIAEDLQETSNLQSEESNQENFNPVDIEEVKISISDSQ